MEAWIVAEMNIVEFVINCNSHMLWFVERNLDLQNVLKQMSLPKITEKERKEVAVFFIRMKLGPRKGLPNVQKN